MRRSRLPVAVFAGLLMAGLPATSAQAASTDGPRPVARAASVTPGLGDAASFVLTNLASGVLGKVGGDGFGSLLAEVGFVDPNTQRLAEINTKLDRLEASVSALHAQVSGIASALTFARLNAVRHRASELVGRIDYARDLMRRLSSGSITDLTLRREKRRELLTLIADRLASEQGFLNHVILDPNGNDDIVRTASLAQRSGDRRFWTKADSEGLHRVIAFYQDEAAQLLLLRVENEFASVTDTSTPAYVAEKRAIVQRMVDAQKADFDRQARAIPSVLTSDTVAIDTTTRILWHQPGKGVFTASTINAYVSDGVANIGGTAGGHTSGRLPTLAEFHALVAGRGGQGPQAYLHAQGFGLATHCFGYNLNPSRNESVFWTQDVSGGRRFAWASHDDGQGQLPHACVMVNRHLAPTEHYW